MKRRSYKYVFIFNCIAIAAIVIFAFTIDKQKNNFKVNDIPVISTPLISAENVKCDLSVGAVSAVILDAKSGAVLFEKNAHQKLPFASTTKIMTALAVIENSEPETVIEVSDKAEGVYGSSIYLKAKEKLTVLDLLYGLMLESGNDAATALAIGVFGSEEKCLEYMNRRAHEFGCVNTVFENVHGLDSDNHKTTAYELSVISARAMGNELFRKIVSTESYTSKGENPRYFKNHNRLLSDKAFTGIKTGYTSKAGRCLVTSFSDENGEYIAVTLNDKNDWNDHKAMSEYAISNFSTTEIANKNTFRIFTPSFVFGAKDNVYLTTENQRKFTVDYKITVTKDRAKAVYQSEDVPLGSFGLERITSE